MSVSEVDLFGSFGPALDKVINNELPIIAHGAWAQAKKSVINMCMVGFWTLPDWMQKCREGKSLSSGLKYVIYKPSMRAIH